ncbi:MAG: hypothetical protein ABIP08_13850, partial [Lautropia sp.]
MSYPPLLDPGAEEPENSIDNMGRINYKGQKGQSSQDTQADPAASVPEDDAETDAPDAPAATDATAGGDDVLAGLEDLDEADLEELNEQVDLGDLGEFAEIIDLADLDALDDPVDPDDIEELDEVLALDDSESVGSEPVAEGPADSPSEGSAPAEPVSPAATAATDAPVSQGLPVPMNIQSAQARAVVDEPIPMLTEVVQVPRYDTEDLPQSFAEVDWGDLAQRVRENVLERLLRRSDSLLDAQLQNTLTPVLERAAETIAHELHDSLNRMIRDIVARAVT